VIQIGAALYVFREGDRGESLRRVGFSPPVRDGDGGLKPTLQSAQRHAPMRARTARIKKAGLLSPAFE